MDPVVKVNEKMKDFLFDTGREVHFVGSEEELVVLVKRIIARKPLNLERGDEYHNFESDELTKFRKQGQKPAKVKLHTRVVKRMGTKLEELEVQGFSVYNTNDLAVAGLSAGGAR
jgi:hypothetical protein